MNVLQQQAQRLARIELCQITHEVIFIVPTLHTFVCHTVIVVAVIVANKWPVREIFRATIGSSDGMDAFLGFSRFSTELCPLAYSGNSCSTELTPGVLGEKSPGVRGVARADGVSPGLASDCFAAGGSTLRIEALSPSRAESVPSWDSTTFGRF